MMNDDGGEVIDVDVARHDLIALLLRGIVALGALAGATFLGYNGTLDAQAVVALYSAVIALFGPATIRAVANGTRSTLPTQGPGR